MHDAYANLSARTCLILQHATLQHNVQHQSRSSLISHGYYLGVMHQVLGTNRTKHASLLKTVIVVSLARSSERCSAWHPNPNFKHRWHGYVRTAGKTGTC